MLEIEGLNAGYGEVEVLFDVELECREGEVVTVVGPNGSGKTTLLNSIFGIADVFSGKIEFENSNLVNVPTNQIIKRGIGYLRQEASIFDTLKVKENLRMGGFTLDQGEVNSHVEEVVSLIPFIEPFLPRQAGTLSGGERRLVSLSMALMADPKLIMLDEPTAGLAPVATKDVMEAINKLEKRTNLGILIVEQNLQDVLQLSKRSYLIVSGKNTFSGRSEELLERSDLTEKYLGVH